MKSFVDQDVLLVECALGHVIPSMNLMMTAKLNVRWIPYHRS